MKRPGSRPFRATVYLPGHAEGGRPVSVAKVSAASEEGLKRALEKWLALGYTQASYEEQTLPLTDHDQENDQ